MHHKHEAFRELPDISGDLRAGTRYCSDVLLSFGSRVVDGWETQAYPAPACILSGSVANR
jgi:hypothetical protein